jgi:mannosyltransferase
VGEHRRSPRLLVAILLVAAVLRVVGSNNSLWFDEIVTVREYVRQPLTVIVAKYNAANNHVMNSVLAHVSVQALGERPWTVRLPAILFGIGGVWAFAFVAQSLWRSEVTLAGTALFAVSYHHVYYSQDARGYSAFVFFALLSCGALFRLLDARSDRDVRFYGLVYALSLGFGTWSLLLMGFVIAGQACVLVVAGRFRPVAWLLAGVAFAAVLYAPMAGPLLKYHLAPPESGITLGSFLAELRPVAPVILVGAPIGALLAFRLLLRAPLQTLLLLVPLALQIVIFPVMLGVSFHPRVFIYGLPIAYFFLMETFDWCLPRFRGVVAAGSVVIVAGSLVLLWRFYPLPKQAFVEALRYVASHRTAGDRVVGLRLAGRAASFYDPSVLVAENADDVRRMVQESGRTWILLTFRHEMRDNTRDLVSWADADTQPETTFRSVIGDGDVEVRIFNGGR